MAGTRRRSPSKGWRRGTLVVLPLAAVATAVGVSVHAAAGGTPHDRTVAQVAGGSTAAGSAAATTPSASALKSAAAAKSASAAARRKATAAAGASAKAGAPTAATLPASTPLAQRISTTTLTLSSPLHYLEQGYNEMPQWTRVAVAAAPGGQVQVAWPAGNGIHVTPLGTALTRSGSDTVVAGAQEVGGLVAHDDGFGLLTRVPDSNKWNETAAALIRYRNGARVFTDKLTGTASDDTSPVLDGRLAWNGTEYGAYFVVHGAGGFADGHFGDKLAYVGASGSRLSGGWSWGCSHNEGIALYPEKSGPFTSVCLDDWRSGLFVSTGIGAPDVAPVLGREQCWAGYCGGAFPDGTGDIVKSAAGRYAVALASRGAASAEKNSADSSGRGWTVTPRWSTHQVAVDFLSNSSTPSGKTVFLTTDAATDHVNVHLAAYGANRLLVSWESLTGATCASGTCTGTFAGTHLELIDYTGKVVTAAVVVPEHISGDIAVLPGGDLAWASVGATPDYSAGLGTSPTTTTLTVTRLHLAGS
ncbi:hypothetical protein [Streptacidiphilus carbonis]|uniref:hypothetical protein n=1 Tax=Streptacidiphilus carbonis TaxID=105422 RepID=UPI0005AAA059|nr:hypothetical protein [Streptacidiphilus carbonis]